MTCVSFKKKRVGTVANWRCLSLFKGAAGTQPQLKGERPYFLIKKNWGPGFYVTPPPPNV